MAAAQFDNTTVDVAAKDGREYLLRTAASVNTFPGFITLYTEGRDDAEEELKAKLPRLAKGDGLTLLDVHTEQKFTQPPPRYTEATLVKTMEQNGIGRPSTYAPTISTVLDREYVQKVKGVFQPTDLGMAVNDFLTQYFPDIINVSFTADMESQLDNIATDDSPWSKVIDTFYAPFDKDLTKALETAEKVKIADEETGDPCPQCGKPLFVKTGRFGKFVACSGYPECRYTQSFQVKTGITCPECKKGELVQRVSKKKRTFYGCNRYPECSFATNLKPIEKPCPKCGGLLGTRGRQELCNKCDYRGKAGEAAAAAKEQE
jgi:DNA topoisomerase-1